MRKLTIAAAAAILSLVAGSPAYAALPTTSEYLVSAPGQAKRASADIASSVRAQGGSVREEFRNVRVVLAQLTPTAAGALSRAGLLVEAPASATTNVTQSPTPSYGLDRIDQTALPLNSSYSFQSNEQGAGVTAYVVDTGTRLDHEQFTGRITNGYNATTDGQTATDCAGHGTHVAGTIGGSTVGIARQVTITPVKVQACGASSMSWTDIIRGINWIISDHQAKGTPGVANFSLGGGAYSTGDNAIQTLIDAGVITVVAAGNSNTDACTTSPARAPNAITVAASTPTDARSSYSNYGSCVDIFAPGGDASGNNIYSSYYSSPTSYAFMAGTSMATPHVVGVVARFLTNNATATPAQVRDTIVAQGTKGVITSAGTGSPNVLLYANPAGMGSVTPLPTPPSAPQSVSASSPSLGTVSVSWSAPATLGTGTLSGYTVTLRNSANTAIATHNVAANFTSDSFTGVAAGSGYTVVVSATSTAGTSAGAVSNTVTVNGVASAPRNLAVKAGTAGRATVSWLAPSTLGGGTLVRYEYRITSANTLTYGAWTSVGTSTSVALSGLLKGSNYYVQVRAVTTLGNGLEATSARYTQTK